MSNANTNQCSECICQQKQTCSAGFLPSSVGDGFCNIEINIAECSFDGEDCCKPSNWLGDGTCDDVTNIAECGYDHGDCCLSSLNTDYCSNCSCSSNGVITSPGFPQHYDYNLDLSWLIALSLGQFIEIEFVRFDVEFHISNCK